jgi:hypothetical protein
MIVESPASGQPEYTFCDVERAVASRVRTLGLLHRFSKVGFSLDETFQSDILRVKAFGLFPNLWTFLVSLQSFYGRRVLFSELFVVGKRSACRLPAP